MLVDLFDWLDLEPQPPTEIVLLYEWCWSIMAKAKELRRAARDKLERV
jgi:hypothetical protein